MPKKTIEQLLQLANNPHYKMTDEEAAELREYNRKNNNVRNNNVVPKANPNVDMHKPGMDTVQPETIYEGGTARDK